MRIFTKSLLALALTIVCVGGGVKAVNPDAISTCVYSTNYASWGTSLPAGWHQENCTVSVGGGILSIVNETDQGQYNDWKAQALVASGVTSKVGNDYIVRIKFKGNVAGTVQCLFGTWGNTLSSPLSVSTDWQTIDVLFDGALSASSFVMFHLGHYVGTIEVESVEVYDNVAARFVKIGENGFATFGTDKALNVEGIVTAYGAKYDGEKIVLTQVTEIPAGAGVIVEAAEDNYKVPVIESAASIDAVNDLLVSDGSVAGDGSTIYALGKKEDKIGFVKVKNGVTIPSGKAYLVITGVEARDFIGFGEEDVTSIESVEQATKVDNQYFNIAGQRVAQPTKGLYIVNGKKVVIK